MILRNKSKKNIKLQNNKGFCFFFVETNCEKKMSAGIQKNKWSVRTVNGKKGEYFIVTGRGYPSVIKGANPTKIIQASRFDREAFYRDPAVKLSMDDLDELDGAEGAPLCVEHKRDDVVGKIHHTWVDPGDPNQGWDIMARIPMNERGKRVVQDIKAGKLNGFSVGYKTDYDQNKHEKVLQGKTFHEISLVEEPFFSGCNLSVSVSASAKEEEIQEGKFLTK